MQKIVASVTKNALWIIFFTVFIDMLGFGILIPVVPLLLADPTSPYFLLDDASQVTFGYLLLGFLTAVFPFGQFLTSPILGQLSDKYGRKKLLALCLIGITVSYILFALGILIRSIPLLFFARFFHGMVGGNIAIAQAAIADITLPSERAKNFGLIGGAFALGFILGPYLGGKLSDPQVLSWFNTTTPFWFATLLSALNAFFVIKILPETHKTPNRALTINWSKSIKNIAYAYSLTSIRPLFYTIFFFQAGFTFFTTFFAVYLIERFGFHQGNIGDYFAYIGLWLAIAQIFVLRLALKRFSEPQILRLSIMSMSIGILLYFLPQYAWQIFLIGPIVAVSNALTQSSIPALISRSVDSSIQGEILGISASVQALAFAIPPLLSGVIAASFSPEASIVTSSIIIFASWLVFLFTYRMRKAN